jgi:hypothetical protein
MVVVLGCGGDLSHRVGYVPYHHWFCTMLEGWTVFLAPVWVLSRLCLESADHDLPPPVYGFAEGHVRPFVKLRGNCSLALASLCPLRPRYM